MAFYSFASDPPPSRTLFASPGQKQEKGTQLELELLVTSVLMDYPEAYRAVAAELRRLRKRKAERKSTPKPGA